VADLNRKVLAMVRKEIQKNPAVTNDVLHKNATRIDPAIKKLNLLQFHGSYRLPIARELAAASGRRRKAPARATKAVRPAPQSAERTATVAAAPAASSARDLDRGKVRIALLDLAREIAGTDSKADVVSVVGSLDRYVDRIFAAVR
jgi:hypothetical protein